MAPEIEVSLDANPATPWMFDNPDSLTSISKLTEATTEMFNSAFHEATEGITLYGVWTTGEWMFHEDGWAWEMIGKSLIEHMKQRQLHMSLVLSKNPIGKTLRLTRGTTVLECLEEARKLKACRVFQLDWWQHNRVLTLLTWKNINGKVEREGIYMRRRLATPLVAPVKVSGEDYRMLQNIFDRYKEKACEI